MGTPATGNLITYPAGTTVIADLNLANYLALYVLFADISGFGVVQFQFFTDATKTQSVDIYQYILVTGNALVLNIPMVSPFVEISAVVNVGKTLELSFVTTPNNMPVLRPVYPGQVRNASQKNATLGAGASNTVTPQYIISGSAYVFWRPNDNSGKLDINIWALDSNGNQAYLVLSLLGATLPQNTMILLPASAIQIITTNNDGAAAHSYSYTVQMIGN